MVMKQCLSLILCKYQMGSSILSMAIIQINKNSKLMAPNQVIRIILDRGNQPLRQWCEM